MSAWSTTSASSRARRGRRATPSARSPDVARLGIVLSAFTPLPTAELLAVAREAEARGYHTAWVGEVAGYDALTVMALLATHTERLHVGSAVVPVQTRTPGLLGMSAASLHHFAPDPGGRRRRARQRRGRVLPGEKLPPGRAAAGPARAHLPRRPRPRDARAGGRDRRRRPAPLDPARERARPDPPPR